jgi:mRNA interferase RelE/StbE
MMRLDPRVTERIDEMILGLADNPYSGKHLKGALKGEWSLRAGDYRVIYQVDEAARTVTLYTVDHRSKVYRARSPP